MSASPQEVEMSEKPIDAENVEKGHLKPGERFTPRSSTASLRAVIDPETKSSTSGGSGSGLALGRPSMDRRQSAMSMGTTSNQAQLHSKLRRRDSTDEDADEDEVVVEGESTKGDGCCTKMLIRPATAISLMDTSLYLLNGDNAIRVFLFNLVRHKIFEGIIILHILANCVFLTLNDPCVSEAELYQNVAEYYFTGVFTTEMLLKITAMGFFMHKGAYLRDPWNVIDFMIVLLSYMAFIPGFGNYTSFRTVRVLRPLRSMNAIPGLKVIVVGMLHSIRGLVHVILLLLFCFCIFGILGVQQFKGLYRMHCVDIETGVANEEMFCKDTTNDYNQWLGSKCPAGMACRATENPYYGYYNFDNIGNTFLLLFTLVTFEEWTSHLVILYDVFGQPAVLYFFFFLIFGAYFVPNLALAVINEKFVEALESEHLRIEEEKEKQATEAQLALAEKALAAPPDDDTALDGTGTITVAVDEEREDTWWDRFRDWMHMFTEGYERPRTWETLSDVGPPEDAPTTYFSQFIIFCIIFNTVLLGSQHHLQPQWLEDTQTIGNYVMTLIFSIEFIFKHLALGLVRYWVDGFNFVDGSVVILSWVELIFSPSGGSSVSVFRALRLLRVLKLLKSFKSLRMIIRVMLSAVKSTGYLNLIVLLYLFIAALLGMQFFGCKFRTLETEDSPVRTTFDSFYWSFLAIFQVMTRDNWTELLIFGGVTTHPAAILFFIGLVLIGDFLILNLFLAILIEAFESDEETDNLDIDNLPIPADAVPSIGRFATFNKNKNRGFSLFDINPSQVIFVMAPMADRIRRSRMKSRTTSIIGYRMSTLRPPSNNPHPVDSEKEDAMFLETENPSGEATNEQSIIDPNATWSQSLKLLTMKKPSFVENTIPLPSEEEKCEKCGGTLPEPLDSPPLIPPPSKKELHSRMCSAVGVRQSKQHVLNELLEFLDREEAAGRRLTRTTVEIVIGQAWACGLLLTETVDELIEKAEKGIETTPIIRSWLEVEQKVLDLRVGEEQVGRSLVAYTAANVPKQHVTNGSYSLFFFGPKNAFRVFVSEIVGDPIFEGAILVCIVISSLMMAFDNPRETPETSETSNFLAKMDIFFTSVFVVEMSLKIIAYGFAFHDGAYIRDGWNILDFIIVIVSVVSLAFSGVNLDFLKVLRAFRALRPLRVITRNRGLKIVVLTLIQSIKGISNVALISVLNYLIFGILGVQLFSGKLYSCTDATVTKRIECIGTFNRTSDSGAIVVEQREWLRYTHSFDNLYLAMMTLLEVSSMEWWVDIMYSCIDADSYEEAPRRDQHPVAGLFFVIFIIIASFFLLNMFVGVVISNFNSVKSHMDGLSLMTAEQKAWVETQRLMLNFRPSKKLRPAKWIWSKRAFFLITRPEFEAVIGVCIVLNIVVLGMDYEGSSKTYQDVLTYLNDFFSFVFVVEMVIKQVALQMQYFDDGWNRFDFFLVIVSIIGVALRCLGNAVKLTVLQVFRVFRILRILRLVKQAKKVRILLESLWYSIPSLGNIGAFMILLFFIYAVLGVQLFYNINHGEKVDDKYTNFFNVWNACGLLFRFVTVTDWNAVMHDCMVQPPDCTEGDNCGNLIAPPLYFISFLLMGAFVLSNLLVAIILDNFNATMQLEKSQVQMADLQRFVEIWSCYDPEATLRMPTSKFPMLLARLRPPLGISRVENKRELLKRCEKYRLPEHGGFVQFVETLIPLARSTIGVELNEREVREHELQWRQTFPDLNELPILRYRQKACTVDQFFSATWIQSAYRRSVAWQKAKALRAQKQADIDRFLELAPITSYLSPTRPPRPPPAPKQPADASGSSNPLRPQSASFAQRSSSFGELPPQVQKQRPRSTGRYKSQLEPSLSNK